ncbi:Polyadenylate-binding protein-interacting protein 1 [Frankliniella fusca]|uniref:Polyadenylate-binding protein-interacting protein 1 n=1 Tax=Frankliniella fusca TaxID=407009 RepID=A0AAE1LIW4_9NEOP|nr:Polyadenylate-binding protein-interacting protein 1 [Frankliniella fusca]
MNPSNGVVKAVGRGRGPWRPDQAVQELRRPQLSSSVQSVSSSANTLSNDGTLDPLSVAMKSTLSANAKEFVPKSFTQEPPPSESLKEEWQNQQNNYEGESDISFDEAINQYVTDILKSITLNPGQFDHLSKVLLDELKPVLSEEEALESIATLVIEQAINETNFRYNGARLCNVFNKQLGSGDEFRRILLDKLCDEHGKIEENLENNSNRVFGFLYFLGELYLQLVLKGGVRLTVLGDALISALKMIISIPFPDNIKHSCAVLKLTGHMLDSDQRIVMNGLFADIEKLLSDERTGTRAKDIVGNILKLRANNWGHGANTANSSKQLGNIDTELVQNTDGIYYGPDHIALTAEQIKFLNDNCSLEETATSGDDATVWDPEASENENEEIAAAFQEFVNHKRKS